MPNKKRPPLDIKALSKKYGFSVNRVIQRWKTNIKDKEIAAELGIDLLKLAYLRKDLENYTFHEGNTVTSVFWLDRQD